MCDPVTITAGITAAISTYSTYMEAAAQRSAAHHNQRIAKMQAVNAEQRGKVEQSNHLTAVGKMVGAARAKMGASGQAVDEGVAGEVTEDIDAMGRYESELIGNNAANEVYGYQAQASNFGLEAANAKNAGKWGTAAAFGQGVVSTATTRKIMNSK